MVCSPNLDMIMPKPDMIIWLQFSVAFNSSCAFLLWKARNFHLFLRMCSNAHLIQNELLVVLSQSTWGFQTVEVCRAHSSDVVCRLVISVCFHFFFLSLVYILYNIKFTFREECQKLLSWILL